MEKTNQFEGWTAQLFDNTKWFIKIVLLFRPLRAHVAADGFVIYKSFNKCLYIYSHGHFVRDEDQTPRWDSGANKSWSN
jgi:hypothetical protein